MAMYYLVAYAKITHDKDKGIQLQGVYFADIATSEEEAKTIGKHCVNTIRGGTILIKVAKITEPLQILDAMYDMTDQFEKLHSQIIDTDKIITKNNQR